MRPSPQKRKHWGVTFNGCLVPCCHGESKEPQGVVSGSSTGRGFGGNAVKRRVTLDSEKTINMRKKLKTGQVHRQTEYRPKGTDLS